MNSVRQIPRLLQVSCRNLAILRAPTNIRSIHWKPISTTFLPRFSVIAVQKPEYKSAIISIQNQGPLFSRGFAVQVRMAPAAIEERVMIVCRNFEKLTADKVALDSNFMKDHGLDSLDHVELIMAIEDEFGFEISDTIAEKLVTPKDICKHVEQRLTIDDGT